MKHFRFESIWLVSQRERKARAFRLNPRKTLILGRNHTGKSTVIRSLFETLGATPSGTLAKWDDAATVAVAFSVDDISYTVVRQRDNRAAFASNGELLFATSSFAEWSGYFAKLMQFNLVVTNKHSEVVPADPACFFTPFYVNQDGSWQAGWNTFRGMQRFKRPWSAILEYFSGICPPEYYSTKAARDQESQAIGELQKELALLERARERFGRTNSLNGPKLNADNFAEEILRLTTEVTDLNRKQEKLRERAIREQETVASLRTQISLADRALRAYAKDSTYLIEETEQILVCPTCNSEHSRDFLDLLTYTEDARVLREVALRLHEDADEAQRAYLATRTSLADLESQYLRISEILSVRRGDLQFLEVVNSMGAESAFAAFEVELKALKSEIYRRVLIVHDLDQSLKGLRNPKRTKSIVGEFRAHYSRCRHKLNVPPLDGVPTLSSRPALSGSGGPRSILAYYSSIWLTCLAERGAFSVPVVIDSPNQQGQDDINLPTVLRFIAEDLPSDHQLIVGLETPTEFSFDETIHLDDPYNLLRAEEFEAVNEFVVPFETKMVQSLTSADPSGRLF